MAGSWKWVLTVCGVHDIVEVIYCETAVLACVTGNATESIIAITSGFVSAFSGEKAR